MRLGVCFWHSNIDLIMSHSPFFPGLFTTLQNSVLCYLYYMAIKKTYTIREASEKLGITPESVLKAIQKGRLKARKKVVNIPQEIWMIDDASVESYVVSKSHQKRGLKRH
jgi:hypothetical protein